MVTHYSHHSAARTVGLQFKMPGSILESRGGKILKSAEDGVRAGTLVDTSRAPAHNSVLLLSHLYRSFRGCFGNRHHRPWHRLGTGKMRIGRRAGGRVFTVYKKRAAHACKNWPCASLSRWFNQKETQGHEWFDVGRRRFHFGEESTHFEANTRRIRPQFKQTAGFRR
jgi:hypothetical protein